MLRRAFNGLANQSKRKYSALYLTGDKAKEHCAILNPVLGKFSSILQFSLNCKPYYNCRFQKS